MELHFLKWLRKKKTNRNFQLCSHVCKQVNFSTININWDIMRNATNSKIKMSVSHLTQKMYCERVMRWATDTSSLESIGHWVQCWGIIFWVLSGTICCKMGGSGTNPTLWIASIVWLWEQFKFFAVWLKSVILWNHWWLNWSVTLLQMKIILCFFEIKENSLNSLHHSLKCNQSKTHVFTLTVFFFFQGRKLIGICTLMLSDISKRSPVDIWS